MRKVIFSGANSLDNFIARKDDAMDWLRWNDEAGAITAALWENVDTVIMGRKTYEVAARSGMGGGDDTSGIKSYIFSRTMKESPAPGVEIVSEDAGEFIRALKHQEGKDICVMGGGDLARSLFEAGVIDEIGFNIHPVLLGSGVPLFHEMNRQIDLELIDCKTFDNGCVLVSYRVKN